MHLGKTDIMCICGGLTLLIQCVASVYPCVVPSDRHTDRQTTGRLQDIQTVLLVVFHWACLRWFVPDIIIPDIAHSIVIVKHLFTIYYYSWAAQGRLRGTIIFISLLDRHFSVLSPV